MTATELAEGCPEKQMGGKAKRSREGEGVVPQKPKPPKGYLRQQGAFAAAAVASAVAAAAVAACYRCSQHSFCGNKSGESKSVEAGIRSKEYETDKGLLISNISRPFLFAFYTPIYACIKRAEKGMW